MKTVMEITSFASEITVLNSACILLEEMSYEFIDKDKVKEAVKILTVLADEGVDVIKKDIMDKDGL
jgi:hypothetical protein